MPAVKIATLVPSIFAAPGGQVLDKSRRGFQPGGKDAGDALMRFMPFQGVKGFSHKITMVTRTPAANQTEQRRMTGQNINYVVRSKPPRKISVDWSFVPWENHKRGWSVENSSIST